MICVLITIVMIFLANEFSIRLAVYLAAKEQHAHMTFAEINRKWSKFMSEDNFKWAYIKDLGMGYVLAAVGLIGTVKQSFRNAGGSYTMKRM